MTGDTLGDRGYRGGQWIQGVTRVAGDIGIQVVTGIQGIKGVTGDIGGDKGYIR